MKLRNVWHEFADFIKLVKTDHPNFTWIIMLGALSSGIGPFVQLFFYARILNKVISGLYQECVPEIATLLIATLVLNLTEKACTQSVNVLKEACRDTIYLRTASKAYTMEYEEYEKTETMDAIRRVKAGESSTGGIDSQIESLYILAKKSILILGSLLFVVMLFTRVKADSTNFYVSIWSSIALVVVFSGLMMFGIKLSGKSAKEFYEVGKKNEHFNSVASYMLSIMNYYQYGKDIRIYSMQGVIEAYFLQIMRRINKVFPQWGKKNGYYTGSFLFLMQMGSGLVYIVLGGKAIYGVISTGEVLLYAGAILQLTSGLSDLIIEYNSFHYRAEYLNSYYEFIHKPNTHYTGTLPVEKRGDVQYEFTLENLSFHYPGSDQMILNKINMKFKIGKKYAIVGRNGAGKTTLVKLLCRLYDPTEGRILLNGIDIRYYDYQEYIRIFSVVFQDFKLLSLPIGDNIASGEEIEEEQAWEVLKQVDLKERVSKLPEQLSTRLYKNNGDGVEVSGGEAQKIAIARALYKDGPFVILDEPTAALDPISEAEIYENFNDMIKGKTAIYISHRMSSCKFCDDIIVLDQGSIAERGSHGSLLMRNGIYAALYLTQAQYYAE